MKLKNPNFFISKTRLQVRNVPLEMDQKQLKRVFFDAVKQRATQANPRVTHAKLLFDPTRPDANGKPRSRGIGFVEFAEHEHALAALRALNNNPTTFTSQRRPIVEFAVEDARAVRKLERRREGLDKAQRERDTEREARGGGEGRSGWGEKEDARAEAPRARARGRRGRGQEALGEQEEVSFRSGRRRRVGWRARRRHESAQGRRSPRGATTPATKPATKRREPAFVPERKPKPPREAPKKRPRDGDAAPARVAGRGLERRDATDDLVDRHVARARAWRRAAARNRPRRSGDGSTTDARVAAPHDRIVTPRKTRKTRPREHRRITDVSMCSYASTMSAFV